jgi:four helix bundle protein
VRDLSNSRVLTRAEALVDAAYLFARLLPPSERFGLKPQIERAAVSVALNIGEGLGRGTDGDLERFLRIAAGSAAEIEIVTRLACRLHGIGDDAASDVTRELTSVRKMLSRFVQSVQTRRRGKTP